MKNTLLYIIIFSVSILCDAKSIEKRYSSHLSNTGIINFFHPQKLTRNTIIGTFAYDMTYISHNDSITLNFSYTIEKDNNIELLILKNDNNNIYGNNLSVMYREVKKHGYEVRVTSRFSFQDIKNIFNNQTPLVFEIIQKDGSCCTASYSKSAWKKESSTIKRILESINY